MRSPAQTLLHSMKSLNGHWIAWAFVAVKAAAWLLAFRSLGSPLAAWSQLGVDPMSITFGDLRAITDGYACVLKGLDIMVENPCDPWGRLANYPRFWQWGAHLGLTSAHSDFIGYSMILAFYATCTFVFRHRLTPLAGLLLGFALTSRPVLLALERGNIDLFAFAFLGLGVSLVARSSRLRKLCAALLLLAAALAKLFPAAAFATWLIRKPTQRAALGLFLSFALYFIVTLDDVRTISRIVPRDTNLSFGLYVAPELLMKSGVLPITRETLKVFSLLGFGLLSLITWFLLKRPLSRLRARILTSELGFAFDAGAAVFVGTFLIGYNYDYRLLFLLLTLPYLLQTPFIRFPIQSLNRRTLQAFGLEVALLVSIGVTFITSCRPSGWRDETSSWIAALLLGAYLVHSAALRLGELTGRIEAWPGDKCVPETRTGHTHG